MAQRMICGVIKLIAVEIQVPAVGGLRARRVKKGGFCEALVD